MFSGVRVQTAYLAVETRNDVCRQTFTVHRCKETAELRKAFTKSLVSRKTAVARSRKQLALRCLIDLYRCGDWSNLYQEVYGEFYGMQSPLKGRYCPWEHTALWKVATILSSLASWYAIPVDGKRSSFQRCLRTTVLRHQISKMIFKNWIGQARQRQKSSPTKIFKGNLQRQLLIKFKDEPQGIFRGYIQSATFKTFNTAFPGFLLRMVFVAVRRGFLQWGVSRSWKY